MLRDREWNLKYTPEDGDLVRVFYVPALRDAVRYDRLSGYFSAQALALAVRGIKGLVDNGGRMRLVVGHTLEPPEIAAVEKGERLRDLVERNLASRPLDPPNPESLKALELLAWMVSRGTLDVRVAVPCDRHRKPIPDDGIFHEKSGIVEDRGGSRIAWTGSLNETSPGWQTNSESIAVFTSWGGEPKRVDLEDSNFARIWAGVSSRVIVLDVPEAVRRNLMRFLPKTDAPADAAPKPAAEPPDDLRSRVWAFIRDAPAREFVADHVGEATAAVDPWPHQTRVFHRLYRNWPPRILIADEVGLGKTIQAGMLLRQAWLAGRAKRILILAPKATLGQWQIELREKFNLNWPIYDGEKLTRLPSPALRGRHERDAGRDSWHEEPFVIASSQMVRRSDRADVLLQAEPWDLLVLDEAHHARRRSAGSGPQGGPNNLLKLMRGLKDRTGGLLLLTATPMQVHPVEVWDLLNLLGLPPEWTVDAFLDFFADLGRSEIATETLDRMAKLYRATERAYGGIRDVDAAGAGRLSVYWASVTLSAIRDVSSSLPRRILSQEERRAAVAIMRAHSPVRRLVSRNTRVLLRRNHSLRQRKTQFAKRQVDDRFVQLTRAERRIYRLVENYIAAAYGRASEPERNAVGFVMTTYRRRLASSFAALRASLRRRRDALAADAQERVRPAEFDEDLPDDEAADEASDTDDVAKLQRAALVRERRAEIDRLLAKVERLPQDTKLRALADVLRDLRGDGYGQVMVFTQYVATMDFLREALRGEGAGRLLCFSGRGGEAPDADGAWRGIGRGEAKRRFRDGEADILLCTDAAAEGLNFQFCGALVNYDMPWNPMRVEQRIGRIDRIGQSHSTIRVVNLHYENTVETDIYMALRERIGLFESVVGPLQPILSRMSGTIAQAVLGGDRAGAVDQFSRDVEERKQAAGFDLDATVENNDYMPTQLPSPITMYDLDRIIRRPDLMPPGVEIEKMGRREFKMSAPGLAEPVRVTTDPAYFEEHPDDMELWSPGSPLFQAPEFAAPPKAPPAKTLREILARR